MTDMNQLRLVFGVGLGTIAAGGLLAALHTWRADSAGQRALARFAERSGLPVPVESAAALEAYIRRSKLVDYIALSAAGAAAGLLLMTPLGLTTIYLLAVLVPVVIVIMIIAAWCSPLHERPFSPAQRAPRIARSRVTTVGDYLNRFPRSLTWVLMGLAIASGVCGGWALATGGVARADMAAIGIVVSAVAIVTGVVLPHFEAAILRRPQPASSELELAWDDALRVTALNAGRQSAAALCIAAALITSVTVFTGVDDDAGWAASVFVLIHMGLTYVYPTQGAPIPRRLYPDGIHVPAGSSLA
ncbi:hypothetical protein HMPREF1529_02954 [Microbacterium sp. oral taxon 186 str. F0373]|uniref:hypothetical protein n=1 Tax=Microbacterium sp. oral taxon 186 TaxID=712383 RepID=UPI00034E73EA|nr:hypothetical protein [Microbacterium sp. oral taxon 186]EPD83572.1 hypothetical protein HMPREF1529_02954 [Microbacterium sp. oral taxon 186 str. F0373]